MGIRLNPFTGELDLVGTTGAGAGTVTSVAGGVGITNTPEPIVGAGTVNLDINSLTTEATLAAGDLFPFVDVSGGGTAITNQRKVTFANLVVGVNPLLDHGTLLGLADDDHAQYTLRAGRAGATNDTTLSTTTTGRLAGSSSGVVGDGLGLSANTGTTLLGTLRLNPDITDISQNAIFQFNNDLTIDASSTFGLLIFAAISDTVAPTWTVSGTNNFIGFGFSFSPHVQNESGVAQPIMGFFPAWEFEPTIEARSAACTAGDVDNGLFPILSAPHFTTSGGGTLTVARVGAALHNPTADAGVTVTNNIGYVHTGVEDAASVNVDIGFSVNDEPNSTVGLANISFHATSAARRMAHMGPAVFGTTAAPQNASVGLELRGTTLAFLPSRMTTAQKNALTAVDGMILYDSDQNKINARENSAWVTFQPLDAGLTALSSLGAGIAVSDGADGWFNRTLQQPAAGITIANANGVAGDPTFSLANDLAALEGLAGTGIAVRSAADTWVQRSIAVTDSASIDFTITDGNGVAGNPTITASVIAAGVDHGGLGGLGDDDHTQYFLLAGRGSSQTASGGTASGDDLTLRANSSDFLGTVFIDSEQNWWSSIPDFTAGSTVTRRVALFDATLTMSPTGGAVHTLSGIRLAPTITSAPSASSSNITFLDVNPTLTLGSDVGISVLASTGTITNTAASVTGTAFLFFNGFTFESATSGVAPYPANTFVDSATLSYNVGAGSATTANTRAFRDQRIAQNVQAGGTYTVTNLDSFDSAVTVVETAGTMNVTTRRGVRVRDIAISGTPQITNNIGVDIEALTQGSSINCGLRNAATTIFTPSSAQTISAAGNAILANATFVLVSNTTGGSLTLTSTPTIADGQNGQVVIIISTGTQNVVIQDQGTLGGSNLRLSAATQTLAPRDNIMLIYSSAVGDWVQIGFTNVI